MTEFKNKNEDIDSLLSKFYSSGEAEQIKNDIAEGDGLFEKFPVPQPSEEMLNHIKLEISRRQRQMTLRKIFACTAATATAAVILIACYFMLHNTAQQKLPLYTQNISQETILKADNSESDVKIAAFEKEIELLRGEFVAIRLNEDNGTNGLLTDRVDNIESEIIETENAFWKG